MDTPRQPQALTTDPTPRSGPGVLRTRETAARREDARNEATTVAATVALAVDAEAVADLAAAAEVTHVVVVAETVAVIGADTEADVEEADTGVTGEAVTGVNTAAEIGAIDRWVIAEGTDIEVDVEVAVVTGAVPEVEVTGSRP